MRNIHKCMWYTELQNIASHATYTIVSWSNHKQWLMNYISDLIKIIKWNGIIKSEMGKLCRKDFIYLHYMFQNDRKDKYSFRCFQYKSTHQVLNNPDSKIHGTHVDPMQFALLEWSCSVLSAWCQLKIIFTNFFIQCHDTYHIYEIDIYYIQYPSISDNICCGNCLAMHHFSIAAQAIEFVT